MLAGGLLFSSWGNCWLNSRIESFSGPCCFYAPRELAPKLKEVGQRVLLLAGDGDWLIPSADEGERLQKLLPRCQLRVCPHHRPLPTHCTAKDCAESCCQGCMCPLGLHVRHCQPPA